ncbi:MAG: hypothetical protein EKK55_18350 [Rhodocyclaceae bacterium]|nr:MAG: hypothetical protein EKK55_18350 [Rhodocyclaceae bacterium]
MDPDIDAIERAASERVVEDEAEPISDRAVLHVNAPSRGVFGAVAYRLPLRAGDAMRITRLAAQYRGAELSQVSVGDAAIACAMAYLHVVIEGDVPEAWRCPKSGRFDPRLVDLDVLLAMREAVLEHEVRFRDSHTVTATVEVAPLVA